MEDITRLAEQVLTIFKEEPGVLNADTSARIGKPEQRVVIDRDKAASYGLSIAGIAAALRTSMARAWHHYLVGEHSEALEVSRITRSAVPYYQAASALLAGLCCKALGNPAESERFLRAALNMSKRPLALPANAFAYDAALAMSATLWSRVRSRGLIMVVIEAEKLSLAPTIHWPLNRLGNATSREPSVRLT